MRGARASLAVLAGLAVCPATALALPPGVHVDPNSPAGKEYALQLPTARGNAVGQTVPQGASPPLFGVGVGPVQATAPRIATRAPTLGLGRRAFRRGNGPARVVPPLGGPSTGSPGSVAVVPPSSAALARLTAHAGQAGQVALLAGAVLLGGLGLGAALTAIRLRKRRLAPATAVDSTAPADPDGEQPRDPQ